MKIEKEIEFTEVDYMTKEDAINEIKKFFKGRDNKKFIEKAQMVVYSTRKFIKLNDLKYETDNWSWEKLLRMSINTELGFVQFYYRKGNEKYAPHNTRIEGGNTTHNINEYNLTIYDRETQKAEEITFMN